MKRVLITEFFQSTLYKMSFKRLFLALTFDTGVLHLIQINHQPDATIFSVYYPDVCLQLNMFRAFSRPSSGAQ